MKKTKTPYWKARKLEELTILKSSRELENLPTKRLLSYYKAERMRRIRYNGCFNDYDHTYSYELDSKYKYVVDILNQWEDYLKSIKLILNQRENI